MSLYIEREKEKNKKERDIDIDIDIDTCVYIYIYIYTCVPRDEVRDVAGADRAEVLLDRAILSCGQIGVSANEPAAQVVYALALMGR